MNGTYFKTPAFLENSNDATINRDDEDYDSFINLLNMNISKKVKIHTVYPYENKEHVFSGIIEESSKKYIILSDPSNGNWYVILLKYLTFIEFEEKVNY